MAKKEIRVGIADMKVARQEGTLITHALGSCIGITLYDPQIKLGAMIHIMLPEAGDRKEANLFKFADTGIKETLRKLAIFGGSKSRYICKIAGGAQMFAVVGTSNIGNIGKRNIEAVKKALREEGIRIVNQDVGSNYARTMLMDLDTGKVSIRTAGREEKTL